MQRSLRGAFVVACLAAMLAASPLRAGTRVYVRTGPPAAVTEVRVAAPSARHVWIAGYHRWDGHAYVWVAGRWELPPKHHTVWVPGHWVHHAQHGWYWVEGHWRR